MNRYGSDFRRITIKYESFMEYFFHVAHRIENVCLPIPWIFEPCWKLVESCYDDLVEYIVANALEPHEFCYSLFLCRD